MPRINFDKIIDTGFEANQRKIANRLKEQYIQTDNELKQFQGPDLDYNPYGGTCEFVEGWIDSFGDEIFRSKKSIDHVISEHDRLSGDILEIDVNAIVHSTQCERCNFALTNLLNHLDDNGNYRY